MQVSGSMTFDEYWKAPQWRIKRPNLQGSVKQRYGDNIYHRDPATGKWLQENSHHSFEDGCINYANVETDTQANRVLLGSKFAYWGGTGPELPKKFLKFGAGNVSILAVRHHKNNFPADLVTEFIDWFESLDELGCLGEPLDWAKPR
jgi:hypothetical protein